MGSIQLLPSPDLRQISNPFDVTRNKLNLARRSALLITIVAGSLVIFVLSSLSTRVSAQIDQLRSFAARPLASLSYQPKQASLHASYFDYGKQCDTSTLDFKLLDDPNSWILEGWFHT